MKPKVLITLFVTLGAVCSFARVVEDSKSRFVLDDVVIESSVHTCLDAKDRGGVFLPENAAYLDGNSVPFRYYRVALPSNQKPSVSLTDSKVVPLGKSLCKGGPGGAGDSLRILPIDVSAPYLRDGLWMTDIRVPLYVKSGSSVSLRKNFRLNVQFNGSKNGVNPGKRVLSKVVNPVAASRFGTSRAKSIKALRKEADGMDGVSFLARFQVGDKGDKSMSTFSEDGLYAVPFSAIRNSLLLWQRQDSLDGIPVERICVYGASQDTLADMGPGTSERNPNHIFEIPIEVRDHTPGGSSPDGIFNEGDTLIFVGYGNAFWKRCDREDPFFVNGKMDYFHSYSPYSFYQKFLFGYKKSGKGLRLSQKVAAPVATGKDVTWMRYTRAEKDALLRDTYFGKELDWERATVQKAMQGAWILSCSLWKLTELVWNVPI